MRRVAILSLLLAGCYQSHRASTDRSDAGARVRRDAGGPARVDAGGPVRVDAGLACDESKLRTSGLVEGWGVGRRCELIVVCTEEMSAWPEVLTWFPDATCRAETDFACGGEGRMSCLASVGVLDADAYEAACWLTLNWDVRAVVCAGDL